MRTGSAQPQLPIKIMNSLLIPIPSIEEQQEIVSKIQIIMEKEENVNKQLKDVLVGIDVMKKTILAKALRGELDTNNPEEESATELLKSILLQE